MRYHNITKDDMLNGDGLRVVLWVAGCSHCCKECHNPLHSANRHTIRGLVEEIRRKYPAKTIWLYTGDLWENILHYPIMKYIDVLVDGEFVQELKNTNLRWRGSSNQRVIDVQQSLKQADPGIPVLHCCD